MEKLENGEPQGPPENLLWPYNTSMAPASAHIIQRTAAIAPLKIRGALVLLISPTVKVSTMMYLHPMWRKSMVVGTVLWLVKGF